MNNEKNKNKNVASMYEELESDKLENVFAGIGPDPIGPVPLPSQGVLAVSNPPIPMYQKMEHLDEKSNRHLSKSTVSKAPALEANEEFSTRSCFGPYPETPFWV